MSSEIPDTYSSSRKFKEEQNTIMTQNNMGRRNVINNIRICANQRPLYFHANSFYLQIKTCSLKTYTVCTLKLYTVEVPTDLLRRKTLQTDNKIT